MANTQPLIYTRRLTVRLTEETGRLLDIRAAHMKNKPATEARFILERELNHNKPINDFRIER